MNEHLLNMLRAAARRKRAADTLHVVGRALVVLLTATLLAVFIDGLLGLWAGLLIAIDLALLVIATILVVRIARTWRGNRWHPRRAARFVEQRMGITDSRLINAVDLSQTAHASEGSAALRDAAVEAGDRLAQTVQPARVVDARPARRALLTAAAAVALVALCYALLPGMFRAVVPRYLQPVAHHPPYTLIRFDVTVEPDEGDDRVYQLRPATIRAELTGPDLPQRATVVFVDASAEQRLPMLRTDRGRFALRIDSAQRSRRFYIDTPAGRSDVMDLTVIPVPVLERIAATYDFPDYTGWESKTLALTGAGVQALEGTVVQFAATSNLPLTGGTLIVTRDGDDAESTVVALTPSADDARTVVGSVTVRHDAALSLTLTSNEGVASHEPFTARIAAVPDRLPRVHIDEPEATLVAPSNWQVPVRVTASDDVGVARLLLHRTVNGWATPAMAMTLTEPQPGIVTGTYTFDLAALGAQPGDVINYYVSAYDNHPSGDHFTDTAMQVISVISEEAYLSFARAELRMDDILEEVAFFEDQIEQLAEQRDALIEQLDALKQELAEGDEPTAEQQRRMEQLDAELDRYVEQAWDLAEQMRLRAMQRRIYDFEDDFGDMLEDEAHRLQTQGEDLHRIRREHRHRQRAGEDDGRQFVDEALDRLRDDAEGAEQFEQHMEQMEREMDLVRLADDMLAQVERMASIIREQRELTDRLAEFSNRETLTSQQALRAQRMAEEQASLEADLNETMTPRDRPVEEAADKLPNMAQSLTDILDELRRLDVTRDQHEAAQLARAGEGRYAHRAAQSAANKLESLLRQCDPQNMQQQAAADLDQRLQHMGQDMRNTLQQLAEGRGLPARGRPTGGSTMRGSRMQVAVRGPRVAETDRKSDKPGAPTAPITDEQHAGVEAETLTPDSAAVRDATVSAMPGVPAPYRDQAEAYFRRLADESR